MILLPRTVYELSIENSRVKIPSGHLSRVLTLPADHVRRLSRYPGSSEVGSIGVWNITGRDGSGLEIFNSRGSGRITLPRPDPSKALNIL